MFVASFNDVDVLIENNPINSLSLSIFQVTNPTSHVTSLSFSPKSEVNKGGVSDSVILDSLGAPKKTVEIPRPVVQDE